MAQQKQLNEERISFGSQFQKIQSVVIWSHLLEKDIMAMGECGIRKLFTLWQARKESMTGRGQIHLLPTRTQPQ